MKRFWLLALLAVSGVAHADTGSLPNGATLSWPSDRLFIHENNSKVPVQPKTVRLAAQVLQHGALRVQPGDAPRPGADQQGHGRSVLRGRDRSGAPADAGQRPFSLAVEFWTGTMCDNDLYRDKNCIQVSSIADINSLSTTGYRQQIPVRF